MSPSDFFDWAGLADRVEARDLHDTAGTMRRVQGPERAAVAIRVADELIGLSRAGMPGAYTLREELYSAAHSIREGF